MIETINSEQFNLMTLIIIRSIPMSSCSLMILKLRQTENQKRNKNFHCFKMNEEDDKDDYTKNLF